jgi:hypothetical protein
MRVLTRQPPRWRHEAQRSGTVPEPKCIKVEFKDDPAYPTDYFLSNTTIEEVRCFLEAALRIDDGMQGDTCVHLPVYDLYFGDDLLSPEDRLCDFAGDNGEIKILVREIHDISLEHLRNDEILFLFPRMKWTRDESVLDQYARDLAQWAAEQADLKGEPSGHEAKLVWLGRILDPTKTLREAGVRAPAKIFVYIADAQSLPSLQTAEFAKMKKRTLAVVNGKTGDRIQKSIPMFAEMDLSALADRIREGREVWLSFLLQKGDRFQLCRWFDQVPTGELTVIEHTSEEKPLEDDGDWPPKDDEANEEWLKWICPPGISPGKVDWGDGKISSLAVIAPPGAKRIAK